MSSVTLIGLLGLVAIGACWALAVVLYRVSPRGSVGRKLALLLVIEGITLITAGFPEFALGIVESDETYDTFPLWYLLGSYSLHHLGDALMLALYPPFLAAALNTRMTQPFARTAVRWPLTFIVLALVPVGVGSMLLYESQAGSATLYVLLMVLFVFALIASIDAWRKAEPGIARIRARTFAIAFGVRDICWGLTYAASLWMVSTQTFSLSSDVFWVTKIIYALGTLLAVPLIAYGILSAHLFDIDLRIRWTIKQSTLAALIIATIFLISEGAATFLSEELGTVAGLLAAAVLIFFLAPLQQFAERVASTAMPNTQNTPEYVAFRKLQVYENALL